VDRQRLTELIRDRIERGDLPRQRQMHLFGSPGENLPCSGCGELIRRDDVEIELEFQLGGGLEERRFHTLCYAIWEIERRV
jgi:hypothetical protein